MTETDPCSGCRELISRPGIRPYCQRGALYGATGCLRADYKTVAPTAASRPRRRRRG